MSVRLPTSPARQPHPVPDPTKWWRMAAYLFLGLGLLLRVVVWWQQRSIVLDEANLIRNYVERSYGQLFHSLDYEQYAPPLFSVAVKACIQAFGNNELSVRLFPLLCSMATLVLFRRMAQRWLPAPFACLALAFVAFGAVFIDYATECKQYATDGFVALGLLEVAHAAGGRRLTTPWALALTGLGAVAVWLSMPAVFVLAGIGCGWLARSIRAQDRQTTVRLFLVGAGWAASFLVYFFLLLKASTQLSNLQTFHREHFLAFPPRSLEELRLLLRQLQLIADRAIGKTVLALVLATVGFALGVWQAIKRREEPFWFFFFPIAACLTASAMHYYSLIPRLTLFFLPLVVVLVFQGLAQITAARLPRVVVLGLTVAVLANQQQLRHLFTPFYGDYAEVRSGLEYIAGHQRPGDVVFLNYNVSPIGRYYLHHRTPAIRLNAVVLQPLPPASLTDLSALIPADLQRLRGQGVGRVWLLYDRRDESFSAMAASQGRIIQRADFERGYVLLLAFSPSAAL